MNRLLPFLLALLATGCATVYTRTSLSGSQPNGLYPATRADVGGSIRYCRNQFDPAGGWRGAGDLHRPTILEKALWVTFSTIDLPISLVTDTLCFPWDVTEKVKNKKSSATAPASPLHNVKLAVGMKRAEAERLIAEATGTPSKYDLYAMDTSSEVRYQDKASVLVVRYKPGAPSPLVKGADGHIQDLPPIDGEVLSWEFTAK